MAVPSPAACSAAAGPASRAFIDAVAGIVVCFTRRSATPSFSPRRKYRRIVVWAGEADGDGDAASEGVSDGLAVTVTVAAGSGEAPPDESPQAASRAAPTTITTAAAISSSGRRRAKPATARRVMGTSRHGGSGPNLRRRGVPLLPPPAVPLRPC